MLERCSGKAPMDCDLLLVAENVQKWPLGSHFSVGHRLGVTPVSTLTERLKGEDTVYEEISKLCFIFRSRFLVHVYYNFRFELKMGKQTPL